MVTDRVVLQLTMPSSQARYRYSISSEKTRELEMIDLLSSAKSDKIKAREKKIISIRA